MTSIPLATSVTATFDAGGNASASVGPVRYGQSWSVQSMVVSTTSASATRCSVYKNTIAQNNLVDSTGSGNNDTSDTSIDLANLDTLIFAWAGGSPSATATAIVYGTMETGRDD
jgi:hypothetical protein